jgi:phage-related protein
VDETLKPIVWMGNSLESVRAFSKPAREDVGFELDRVQRGFAPRDWKPMPSVGSGVIELRVHAETEHRVFYVARFKMAVYVLHAFVKKSQRTSLSDVAVAKQRFRELLRNEELK